MYIMIDISEQQEYMLVTVNRILKSAILLIRNIVQMWDTQVYIDFLANVAR